VKALSLTQPWAWLVVHGGKDIENRKWNTKFRGEFLIHAAKGMKESDYYGAWDVALEVNSSSTPPMPRPEELDRGGIVGVAELFNVQPPLTWIEKGRPKTDPWHFEDQFGFRLRNVRPLPFLPCKGALGFWGNFEIRDGKAVQL
jgi:hypothetical protein